MKAMRSLAALAVAATWLLSVSCTAFPSATPEKGAGQGTVRAFWILSGGASEAQEALLERLYLPTSLAALFWTEFSVAGGQVELESRCGYRVLSRKRVLVEALGAERTVYGYELRLEVVSPPPDLSGAVKGYEVSFSYPQVQGGKVEAQPLQQALVQAIRQSGRKAGRGRVVSLSYRGSGRFSARVQLS
jgi:hypothetical protein